MSFKAIGSQFAGPGIRIAATLCAALLWQELAWANPDTAAASAPQSLEAQRPAGPLLLTRTVVRSLRDGKQIVTRRTYRVTVRPESGGYLAEGTLIESQIDAPPQLRALANLERTRPGNGGFPYRLGPDLMIKAAAPPQLGPQLDQGMVTARGMIAAKPMAPGLREQADAFITAASQGQPIPWPVELFSPQAQGYSTVRDITLADGTRGAITITQTIPARLANGQPARLVREVATTIGETVRTNREEWTIALTP